MNQFVNNAINQLKQTYEVPLDLESSFRQCYEILFKLTAEREEHGANESNRQQIDQANKEMAELLHNCSLK